MQDTTQQQQGAPAKLVPGTQEYDAAMIAKFENRGVLANANADDKLTQELTGQQPKQRPDNVPEKFWDAEKGEVRVDALAKSYDELQKLQSKGTQQSQPANTPAQTPAVDPAVAAHATKKTELQTAYDAVMAKADATADEIRAAHKALKDHGEPPKPAQPAGDPLAGTGLNMAEFTQEFVADGKLSDASYEKLTKAGIPQEMVNAYIEGQKAQAELQRQSSFKVTGGEENYNKMLEWAKASLSNGEKIAFNDAVAASAEARNLAITGLFQKYTAANGSDPQLLGGTVSAPAAAGYGSVAEMKSDMRDPRYRTDAAYRQQVERKVAATTAF